VIRVLEPRRVVTHVARVMVSGLEVTYELLGLLSELDDSQLNSRRIEHKLAAALTARKLVSLARDRDEYYAGPALEQWLKDAHHAGIGMRLAESAAMARWP
jgi:hypothetical protein